MFLNLSKEEQRTRFLKRLDLPEKNWKFSASDVRERRYWDDYQMAFSEMLSNTSTEWAPWYVIPADHKWFARICVSAVLAHTLMEIDPQYPEVGAERRRELERRSASLEAEAPAGRAGRPVPGRALAPGREGGDAQGAQAPPQGREGRGEGGQARGRDVATRPGGARARRPRARGA